MDEFKNWIKLAKEDLKTAEYNKKGKKYKVAAFLSQQAAEKALKALAKKKKGEIRKIHDLVILGKDVGISNDLLQKLKELSPVYIYTRYPDVPEIDNIKDKVTSFLETAKEVIKWVEENL